ncbi:hypothetical protein ACJMK2_025274 [Sinanodonta woodiana]|uniref:C-type lectin domain-containing protein n=1 Tax=Sinanodonta woodiana TaxID=1069815 RepID=A0ABD3XHI3_SINWO
MEKCSSSHNNKRESLVTCIECCNTDFCNVEGCGVSAVPKDKRGPYCYQCDVQEYQNSCRDITVCGVDQACILERSLAHLPDNFYRSRCGEKHMCLEAQHIHNNEQSTPQPAEILVGKRSNTYSDCPACCYTDFCNDNCTQNNSVAVHGITQAPTSLTITNVSLVTTHATTTHHELTKATKLVTDVNQHHTSMHTTVPTHSTKHQTLAAVTTHPGTHLHQEQASTHVPSITHAAQELNIQDLWIGGSDVNHTDTFYWQNGVEVRSYTNWGKIEQQPNDPHYHDQDCIILHRTDNYTWYDEPCYRVYGFICEHPLQDVHTSTHQTTSCESQDGFHQLEHNLGCVMYVQIAMDWQSASNYCTKHHSHLVTINSQKKQDVIHRFVISHGANDTPWIGLYLPHNQRHWQWESGLHDTYNNWGATQPEGPGTCVIMGTNGHWRNKICSSNHPFICQK